MAGDDWGLDAIWADGEPAPTLPEPDEPGAEWWSSRLVFIVALVVVAFVAFRLGELWHAGVLR